MTKIDETKVGEVDSGLGMNQVNDLYEIDLTHYKIQLISKVTGFFKKLSRCEQNDNEGLIQAQYNSNIQSLEIFTGKQSSLIKHQLDKINEKYKSDNNGLLIQIFCMQLVTPITYLKEALESIEDLSKKVKYYDGAANV